MKPDLRQQWEIDKAEVRLARILRGETIEPWFDPAVVRMARRMRERGLSESAVAEQLEWGRQAQNRGRRNEERLLAAITILTVLGDFGMNDGLSWVHGARLANQDEDRSGIDVVVDTDVGPLHLQSKSSKSGVHRFRRDHRNQAILCVLASEEDSVLIARTRRALVELRDRISPPDPPAPSGALP